MRSFPKLDASIIAGALFLCGSLSFGASSHLVGVFKTEIPGNSDGILSAAFHQLPKYRGVIASIDDADSITLDGANFTSNQFANSHYVLFGGGDREGLWATIAANDGDSLDLTFVLQDLGDTPGDRVEVGDPVRIIPFWTPATLIPDIGLGLTPPGGTELFVFSRTIPGSDLSAVATYRYVSGHGWFNGPEEVNDHPMYPDESIVLRNNSDDPIQLIQAGRVPMSSFRTVLSSVAQGVQQDIRLTTGLPVSVSIQDLLDPGAAGAGDQILVFDHNQSGQNRDPLFTATYAEGSGWLDGDTDVNNYLLEKGRGFIYRKAQTNSDDIVIRHKPHYQN